MYHRALPPPGGYRDTLHHLNGLRLRGVWLSDEADNDRTTAVAVVVDLDDERLAWYRVELQTSDDRGWCIPADVLNPAIQSVLVVASLEPIRIPA